MLRLLEVVGLNSDISGHQCRDVPTCLFDGKPCDGVWLFGAPACFVDSFGVVKGKSKTCSRLKKKRED